MGTVVVVVVIVFFAMCLIGGMAKGWDKAKVQARYQGKKLSQVGTKTEGGLACPNCGSTSFESKRSAGGKLAGGVLAPKSRVKCVACGVEFVRG